MQLKNINIISQTVTMNKRKRCYLQQHGFKRKGIDTLYMPAI